MESSTPREFLSQLEQGNFQAALTIGKRLHFDTDVVYKKHWLQSVQEGHPDLDLLEHIQNDDAFVVYQCLVTLFSDPDLQRSLLGLGQTRTQDKEQEVWLQCQSYLQDYLDRLDTLVDLTNYSVEAYGTFRDADLVSVAKHYAHQGNASALRLLFDRHGAVLGPHRLAILSAIPVTADPAAFDLPHASDYDADEIRRWYLNHSRTADQMGLCSQALAWTRYAQAMGVRDIDEEATTLDWLCKYVYTTGDIDVSWDTFGALEPRRVLEGLLSQTNASTVVNDMRALALPWLQLCARRQKQDRLEQLLYDWILRHADLASCTVILENSKPTLPHEDRIIQDDEDVARMALAVIYASKADDAVNDFVRIFECLPIFDTWEAGEQAEGEPTSVAPLFPASGECADLFKALQSVGPHGLTQMMDTLQVHLGTAETLSRYHASVPMQWYLTEHSVETKQRLCTRMASQAAGGVETGGRQFDSDNDWRELLDDMMQLRGEDDGVKGIFAELDQAEIFETFFSSLLRCGSTYDTTAGASHTLILSLILYRIPPGQRFDDRPQP